MFVRAVDISVSMMRSLTRLINLNSIIIVIVALTYILVFVKYDSEWPRSISRDLPERSPKYILLWTSKTCAPFNWFGEGRYATRRVNCSYTDCYITSNRSLLRDYTEFDAILFNGRELPHENTEFPARRSPHQLYVYVQLESADRFPVCKEEFVNFFNRTFTYRLDSDYLFPYLEVRNMLGDIIGPRVNMTWIQQEDMLPVSEKFGDKLRRKSRAAAWFVSNCKTRSGRETFVNMLQTELARLGLSVDIYGKCGILKCPRGDDVCYKYIEKDYYFYLAFENSFDEDYVTEKVLTGLLHDAVPIVYGGANYTRFLPHGSYIDARRLGAPETARVMYELMNNHTRYRNMFRWKQHYQFSLGWPPPVCSLCEQLHTPQEPQVSENFRKWWNPNYKKVCPKHPKSYKC